MRRDDGRRPLTRRPRADPNSRTVVTFSVLVDPKEVDVAAGDQVRAQLPAS